MSPVVRGILAIVFGALMAQLPDSARGDETEQSRLHAVLQSDAPVHDKAVACKRLAVIGTRDSVPVLAGLLDDERLSHYARFGLEAIPDPSVDQALRDALGTLKGPHLIGVINSLGNRRDAAAVEALVDLLSDSDQQTAATAAGALGRIANERAVRTLLAGLDAESNPIRPAFADACLTAADVLLADGNEQAAAHVYRAVREADVQRHIRIAAAIAAIRIGGTSSLALLTELLRSEDEDFFAAALQASREIRDESMTAALIAEVERPSAERQALLITALADREDPQVLPVLLNAARSKEPVVQVAAIRGLARAGDSSVVDVLMELAASEQSEVAAAAIQSLEALPGTDADEALLSPAHQEDPKRLALVIQLAGRRRIASAVPLLRQAAESDRESIRIAALSALGETVGSDELGLLVEKVLAPASTAEKEAAQAALKSACVRMPDRDACARQMQSLFAAAPADRQVALFELLRELGGGAALSIVVTAARAGDDVIQDAATRSLGEWLTDDVAPELLALARSPQHRKYQVRALRGYIRIIRQFGLPIEQRAEMARNALNAAERNEERQLVLEALVRFPSPQALSIAVEQLGTPGLKAPAAQAALALADRLFESEPDAVKAAMQRVVEANVNEDVTKRAAGLLEKLPQ